MAGSSGVSFGYWAVAGALAVAAGVGVAVWHRPSTVEVPAPPQHGIGRPEAPTPAPPTLAVVPGPLPTGTPADAPPPGITAAEWRSLQAELAGRPDELRRIGDYFVFADQVQRFRALGSSPARDTDRMALARALDASLDQRLRARELSAAEARWIKIAVLEVLVDGDPARRQALADWEAGAARVASPVDAQRAAERNAEFQRRQADLVAVWSAVPAEQRDRRALERQLDALRNELFAPAR
jgi:hypothetical protein